MTRLRLLDKQQPSPRSADPSHGDGPDDVPRWITEARAGSRDALGKLLAACRGRLLEIAEREVKGGLRAKIGASDLVQETMLEAEQAIDQFRGGGEAELLAWLRRILKNNLLDEKRRFIHADKRKLDRETPFGSGSRSGAAEAVDSIDTPSVLVNKREQVQELHRVLASLPEDYRQVIELRNWQLLPFSEIGARMERSEEAARKIWVRAIERLQREITAAHGTR